jgi:phage portal protein BeeE
MEVGISADWSAIKYNKRFFDNDGTPGAVFSTEQQLTDAQYDRLKNQLITSRKGVDHAFRAMLLDGGVKLTNTAPNNRDMQFLENRKFSREEIAMILGSTEAGATVIRRCELRYKPECGFIVLEKDAHAANGFNRGQVQ